VKRFRGLLASCALGAILGLVFLASAQAAIVHAGPTATGNGSGSDWNNIANFNTLSLVRGNTYYLQDGTYAGKTLSTAVSGSTLITVKKAIGSDHGTDTGWISAYGDGQATFNGTLTLTTDYWVLDGQTRNASNWADGNSYGYRATDVYTSAPSQGGSCASNITVRYMNLGGAEGTTYTGSEPGTAIYNGGFFDTCTSWTIEYNYLHNIGSFTLIQFAGTNGATVQYNHFRNSWGKEAIRGQGVSKNLIIRWNQFYNACGYTGLPGEGCTAEIAIWGSDSPGDHDNNEIYGNWFMLTRDSNSGGTIVVGGNGGSWFGVPANNTKIYNNTIAGHSGGNQAGYILVNGGSGNICRNTLWYDTPVASASCNTTSNNVDATSDPFTSYAGANLHLAGATAAGFSLSSPYNVDMDGNTRGADGTWDLGAYERNTGGTRPSAPTLRIVP